MTMFLITLGVILLVIILCLSSFAILMWKNETRLVNEYYESDKENKKLKKQLLLSESQNYCKICGNILDGYTSELKNES